jgi:cell division septal protein FtsQ
VNAGARAGPMSPGAPGAPGAGRVLPFRRRASLPRRRRRSLLLGLVRPLAAALATVGLPLALATWVVTSPCFALRRVEVHGTRRIPAAGVRRSLAPLLGENLVTLPLPAVASLVAQNPWVASVEMEKELPDGLRLRLAERRAVALVAASGGALSYADLEGRAIAPVGPSERPAGMLVVRGAVPGSGSVAKALAVASDFARANPDWAACLEEVEVLGEEDFRLHTRSLPFPLLVRGDDVRWKVSLLERLLPELGRRYVAFDAIDLRFSRRIVVQPQSVNEKSVGLPGNRL